MQRYGQVIGIRPEQIASYERIHAHVWPQVLATIRACNIRNYSIFWHGTLLFAYFEYIGEDFAADMASMAYLAFKHIQSAESISDTNAAVTER